MRGNAIGEHAYTLTVTATGTGWTENRSAPNKARFWVIAALADITKVLPFPLPGIDSEASATAVTKVTATRNRSTSRGAKG